ncbi:cytochrome c/ABC transporter substrate-binding protein [Sideroxydans lithotrophicus]|uniref:Cytochrome c domain-containing protein n=1 Tax=Sideroxydans lithotrophicus (strain ES-1) TaxID=580332 RepID=D5CSV5_SIDLE|nr:c-type cytochrome [Sideroxydans lithotrophicus]ADE12041.1 conserved hypothetical protein [Sideroxydans lithotrophicus ES-1]
MRVLTALILFILLNPVATAAPAASAGETLYRQGLLPDGTVLQGTRAEGGDVTGAEAACVACHRRSGLGTQEGRYVIPPIIGKYLFRAGLRNIEDMTTPHVAGYRPNRSAYTDATLARAIRDGLDADGRKLNYLMPRFKLDDATMASLVAYLKQLTSQPVPGVSEDTLQFATIITPDADPVKRKAMLSVLNQFFADKNSFIRGGHRAMHSVREIKYRVIRQWQLHVWELSGPPETWEQQLRKKLAAEPVFAVISGLGGKTWAPVHRFCEDEEIPCLLPNVDAPVVAENDFYPVYFSKGVLLEAQLIAEQIRGMQQKPLRVTQIFRRGDIGEQAAQALRVALPSARMKVNDVVLPQQGSSQALTDAIRNAAADSAVVLWLRPGDLAALPKTPPATPAIFISGLMGGLENAPVPASWRTTARLTYPFDLPDQRRVRMDYPFMWFKVHQMPVIDERVQTDTYLACGILAETLSGMLDSFVRDYLVERVETMLSYRVITGYYPRLGLAPGQRFASKGGYMVRFADLAGPRLVADGNWIVP